MDKSIIDDTFKIMLIGDNSSGKVELLNTYTNTSSHSHHLSKCGVDLKNKTIKIDGLNIQLNIYNIANQDFFRNITYQSLKGTNGLILIYDIDNRESFYRIERHWMIKYQRMPDINFILIGNKVNSMTERQVTKEEAELYAKQNGLPFKEVDSINKVGVEEAFLELARVVKSKRNIVKKKKHRLGLLFFF